MYSEHSYASVGFFKNIYIFKYILAESKLLAPPDANSQFYILFANSYLLTAGGFLLKSSHKLLSSSFFAL